jgi:hypothetical protein
MGPQTCSPPTALLGDPAAAHTLQCRTAVHAADFSGCGNEAVLLYAVLCHEQVVQYTVLCHAGILLHACCTSSSAAQLKGMPVVLRFPAQSSRHSRPHLPLPPCWMQICPGLREAPAAHPALSGWRQTRHVCTGSQAGRPAAQPSPRSKTQHGDMTVATDQDNLYFTMCLHGAIRLDR